MKRKKKKQRVGIGFCQKEKKTMYRTKEDGCKAITLMFGIVNITLKEYQDLHSYKCDHGEHYHVGHKSFYEMKLSREVAREQVQQPQA